MDSYEELVKKYPDKIYRIQYEHLAYSPIKTSEKLFQFIYGSRVISKRIMTYIRQHFYPDLPKNIRLNPLDTFRNSKEHSQNWRTKITQRYLTHIEKDRNCREIIKKLKYNLFKKLKYARNLSIPLFT